jgi:hypothetical protein
MAKAAEKISGTNLILGWKTNLFTAIWWDPLKQSGKEVDRHQTHI